MKIVRKRGGKSPKEYFYRVTCPECGCVFTCEEEDVHSEPYGYTGYTYIDKTVCPECCESVIVCNGNDGIPSYVKRTVNYKQVIGVAYLLEEDTNG